MQPIEIDMSKAIFPTNFVRESCIKMFGIGLKNWQYHIGKAPGPDIEMAGYRWYSVGQFELVKAYFMRQPGVRRRMKNIAETVGA